MDVLNKMKENQRIMIAKIEGVQATQEELVAGQAQIIKMGEATQDLVKKSTSKLCKAVFEATEVSTPTRFVILPYVRARELQMTRHPTERESGGWVRRISPPRRVSGGLGGLPPTHLAFIGYRSVRAAHSLLFARRYELPPPTEELSEEEQQNMLDKAESWVGTVTNLVEEGQGAIQDPASYATNFLTGAFKNKMAEVKEKLVEEHLYLYLVDEYSNEPVYDNTGVYPIKIETKSELVDK